MTMAEIQAMLTTMMRTIDKKTVLTVEQSKDNTRSAVTVHLSRDRRKRSFDLADADLVASQNDLMRRSTIRTTLKQAHDRMWQVSGYIFNTKMEEHKQESAVFRPMMGGGGRGGRR